VTKPIAFIAGLFLLATSFIGAAVPASAHADLVSTDPVDGSVVESAPESITLNFNSAILDSTAELAVSNSAGELVTGVVTESAQTSVTAAWPAGLPGDTYKVAYRVVSEDGHPITGSFSFSYPASVSESVSESAPAVPASAESPSESGSTLIWVLGFLALALVVAGFFLWRKRSR